MMSFEQIRAVVDNDLLPSLSETALKDASYGILFRKDPRYLGDPHPPMEFPGEVYAEGELDRLDGAIWDELAIRHERECSVCLPVDLNSIVEDSLVLA